MQLEITITEASGVFNFVFAGGRGYNIIFYNMK